MGFILENVKRWLWKEILMSGDPHIFFMYVRDALDEIEDEIQDMTDEDFALKLLEYV